MFWEIVSMEIISRKLSRSRKRRAVPVRESYEMHLLEVRQCSGG